MHGHNLEKQVFKNGISPKAFSGPIIWMKAPKVSTAVKNDITTVTQIIKANFWKKTKLPPNRKAPDPKVVIDPLKILTPISL